MTKITLQPTLALTDCAKAHLQQLQFGPETALMPRSATFERKELNWFGRSVKKIDQYHSLPFIIGRVALAIFLTLSLVGIPLLVLHYREWNRQNTEATRERHIIENLNDHIARINKRAKIVENLELLQQFQTIPQLDLKDQRGATGYIDFLAAKDLSANIMKGTDKDGRAFITFKLQKVKEAHPFVVTIFERYRKGAGLWVSGSQDRVHFPRHLFGSVQEEDLLLLRRIIAGQNPDFRLA
ncbi:MAG: hypothetical protein LLG04_12275 [Parachlamydia sp.]|nr:hypothetical protein [Parachlamydia sp.]